MPRQQSLQAFGQRGFVHGIYEPALVSETPPRVGFAYHIMSALVTRTFSLADWRRRMISFGKEIR